MLGLGSVTIVPFGWHFPVVGHHGSKATWPLQQSSCQVSDGFYAKCSGKVLLDGGSVEVVLLVSGGRHDEEAVGKAGAVLDTSDNMRDQCVQVSCNKTVNPCLCVSQHKLNSW